MNPNAQPQPARAPASSAPGPETRNPPLMPLPVSYASPGPGVFGDRDITLSGPMPPASLAIVRRLARRRGVPAADLLLCALDTAVLSLLGPDADEETRGSVIEDARRWSNPPDDAA